MSTKFFFNDLEALKIAIDIENRGERFYTIAANKLKDDDVKEMLLDLAQQESEHAETFEKLYNDAISDKEKFDDTYLFEPEISNYLSAMVQTVVFPSDEEQDRVMKNINDVEDVLNLGIQAEKESILFYTEMIIYSKLIEAKEAFRALLKEEKKHLIDLQTMLNNIKSRRTI